MQLSRALQRPTCAVQVPWFAVLGNHGELLPCQPPASSPTPWRLWGTCHLAHPERAPLDRFACLLSCGPEMCVLCTQPASPWVLSSVLPCSMLSQATLQLPSQPVACRLRRVLDRRQLPGRAGEVHPGKPALLPLTCPPGVGLQQQTCLPCHALVQATAAQATVLPSAEPAHP